MNIIDAVHQIQEDLHILDYEEIRRNWDSAPIIVTTYTDAPCIIKGVAKHLFMYEVGSGYIIPVIYVCATVVFLQLYWVPTKVDAANYIYSNSLVTI